MAIDPIPVREPIVGPSGLLVGQGSGTGTGPQGGIWIKWFNTLRGAVLSSEDTAILQAFDPEPGEDLTAAVVAAIEGRVESFSRELESKVIAEVERRRESSWRDLEARTRELVELLGACALPLRRELKEVLARLEMIEGQQDSIAKTVASLEELSILSDLWTRPGGLALGALTSTVPTPPGSPPGSVGGTGPPDVPPVPGVWARPAGVKSVQVQVIGGGGGGSDGTAAGVGFGGGGGGSGGCCIGFIDVSGLTELSVIIGSGGVGGATGSPGTQSAIGKGSGDGVMTIGDPNLQSTLTTFLVSDIGSPIVVVGAGAGGANLSTMILAFVDYHNVTLLAAAGTTVGAARFAFGQNFSSTPLCRAGGGQGAPVATSQSGGAGGTAVGGTMNFPGNPGAPGIALATAYGGNGAGSYLGGGGQGAAFTGPVAAVGANGGGGGGGSPGVGFEAGAAGGDGVVIITNYT